MKFVWNTYTIAKRIFPILFLNNVIDNDMFVLLFYTFYLHEVKYWDYPRKLKKW